jgi:hypothetical protein
MIKYRDEKSDLTIEEDDLINALNPDWDDLYRSIY